MGLFPLTKDLGGARRFMLGLLILCLAAGVSSVARAETKMLLIGDSLSSGYGLSGPGWVELTNQALLEQGHDVSIVNDSISGDTTAGGVARIEDGLRRIQPDWLIIELGGNDGLRGLPPKEIESNLNKMVAKAQAQGVQTILLGILIPPNYGKVYTDKFASTFMKVSESTDSPLLPFFIGAVGGDPELNQADMIHPNDKAQPLIRDRVLPFIKSVLGIEE